MTKNGSHGWLAIIGIIGDLSSISPSARWSWRLALQYGRGSQKSHGVAVAGYSHRASRTPRESIRRREAEPVDDSG